MCQVATFDAAQAQTLPTRAERRRVRGRTRARARDCSSRASWELSAEQSRLNCASCGGLSFFRLEDAAESERPRLLEQGVAGERIPKTVPPPPVARHHCLAVLLRISRRLATVMMWWVLTDLW